MQSQQPTLCLPIKRKTGVAHEPGGRQLNGVAALEEGLCDARGKEGETDQTREVGGVGTLLFRSFSEFIR